MKKLLYIFWFAVSGMGFSSCTLDLEPKAAVTFEHFFRNEEDLFALVAEMHGELRTTLSGISYQEHMGARIDWVNPAASDFEKLRNLEPIIISRRDRQQQWKRYYNVITLTDLFFDNYTKAQNVTPSRLDFCLGQCYFLRAVSYMYLARTWGDAVITRGSMYSDKYAKSPAKVVIDTAINSALRAYELLPKYNEMRGMGGKVLTSRQYGCKGSTAAVLAHLYAWKGSIFNDTEALVEAEKWASKLIDPQYTTEVGQYTLAPDPEAVCEKTLVRGGEETVFELEINYFETDYAYFLTSIYLVNYPLKLSSAPQDALKSNYGIYVSTVRDLYSIEDKRRTAYFYQPDNPDIANSAGLAYLYKWRKTLYRQSGGGEPAVFRNLDCNKVIFRLADIILLRAECRAKLGNVGGASEDLNTIRSRAGAPLFPMDGENVSDLQKIVFREREKELLLEGGRYYDVRRNGTEYVRSELSEGFRELSDADIRNGALYLPVPQSAFENNDLMIQNTYWLSKMK